MKAFNNNPGIKLDLLNKMKLQCDLDGFIKNVYKHKNENKYLDIPLLLIELIYALLIELSNNNAIRNYPLKFIKNIKIGADLSKVYAKFAIDVLTNKDECNLNYEKCKVVIKAFQDELEGKVVDWKHINLQFSWMIFSEAYEGSINLSAALAASWFIDHPSLSMLVISHKIARDALGLTKKEELKFNEDKNSPMAIKYKNIRINYYLRQSEKLLELLKECK